MKIHEILFITCFVIFSSSCDESDSDQRFTELIGVWEVEQALLDSELIDDWTGLEMEVRVEGDDVMGTWTGLSSDMMRVWPETSTWMYFNDIEENIWHFIRDDGITLTVDVREDNFNIELYILPEEECPRDEEYLICTEKGSWYFSFIRK